MIVNREEFIRTLNSDIDINWEQTARENIAIIFKLHDKLEKIKEMCIYDCQYECSNNSQECDICSCLEQRIIRLIEGAEDE